MYCRIAILHVCIRCITDLSYVLVKLCIFRNVLSVVVHASISPVPKDLAQGQWKRPGRTVP